MNISKNEIVYVANLARLDLDEESINEFSDQVNNILEYVNTLNSVDTKGVKPTSHAIFLKNVFREDEPTQHLDRNVALSNAPEQEDGNFIVPKVIN